jgi:hypothetical protein
MADQPSREITWLELIEKQLSVSVAEKISGGRYRGWSDGDCSGKFHP